MFKWIQKGLFVQDSEGKRKLGPLIWVLGALLIIIPSILLFKSEGSPLSKRGETKDAPEPFQKNESNLTQATDMPNTMVAEMDREIQIAQEQSSGLRGDDLEVRKKEIKEKYEEKAKTERNSAARINFDERLETFTKPEEKPTPVPSKQEGTPKPTGYMTFAERIAAEGKANSTRANSGGVVIFKPGDKTPPSSLSAPGDIVDTSKTTPKSTSPSNLLPLGTFIPVVLEQDVISTDLQSHVWATVATDVTFRRQLQLPLGLVRLRGNTATEPVQNLLDIVFDVMVFSDGTELPIQGFAYSAFDIRFPDRYRVRGVPGKLITPPMYTTILSILLTAGLGASDAYMQNYINQQTETQSSFTTVPTIDPNTGEVTNVIQQTQGQPVNNNIGATMGLSAAQSGAEALADRLQKDLDKYKPYVKLEKGTPIFVQLESTVNVNTRRINGLAIQQDEARRNQSPNQRIPTYAPGDARALPNNNQQTPSILDQLGINPQTQNQNMGQISEDQIVANKKAVYAASQNPEIQNIKSQQEAQAQQKMLNMIQQLQKTRGITPTTTP